jgi:disulfide bond formation protein DsbB
MTGVRTLLDTLTAHWALTFVAASLGLLGAAWTFQYGFGYVPCELCLTQRYPYMLIAALGAVAYFTRRHPNLGARRAARGFIILITLLFFLDAVIALYHVGVEQAWWQGPTACTVPFSGAMTYEEMREAILTAAPVRCDVPAWTLFGISMAGYNGLAALALAAFGLYAFRRTSRS